MPADATKVAHPNIKERRALGKELRKQYASVRPRRLGAGRGPSGSRSRCSRSRTPPVSPTSYRCATAA